jgi:transposase
MSQLPDRVVIGMDPHKRSVTVEVMARDETVLDVGRFGTDRGGYRGMLAGAKRWPNRVWAIEGCQGIGRYVALRLLRDGEDVVDVPPKLSARARVFATLSAAVVTCRPDRTTSSRGVLAPPACVTASSRGSPSTSSARR